MAEITLVKDDTSALDRTWMSMPYGHPAVPARGHQTHRVNPGVEVGLNPQSHPWTDAADSC